MRISHSDFSEPGMRLAQFELQKEQLIERFGNAACAGFEERVKKRISCCGEDLAIAAEILRVQIWVYDTLGMQNAIKPTVAVVRDPIHIENCVLTDSAGASTEHYMLLMKDGHDALKRPWETPTTKLQEQKNILQWLCRWFSSSRAEREWTIYWIHFGWFQDMGDTQWGHHSQRSHLFGERWEDLWDSLFERVQGNQYSRFEGQSRSSQIGWRLDETLLHVEEDLCMDFDITNQIGES